MAWQLLNRVYTVGTIDGSGDISPGVAQEGFSDFTALSGNNDTYIVAFQGANWEAMKARKIGAILRRQATIDSSNSGAAVSFDTNLPISVISDVGAQKLVYVDGNGDVQNADPLFLSLAPATLADLKAEPLPASGEAVRYLRNITGTDRKSAFYIWKSAEATAGDDFNYVVSDNSASGRWVRQKPIIEVPALSANADAYNASLYAISDDLRHKSSTGLIKKVARVENVKQGSFATIAALKAVASTQFANGDTAELRGRLADGDLLAPLTVTWVAASTNTDSLDIKFIRPDDVSGANAGRWEIPTPVIAIKFDNSDATPSVKNGVLFTCADTAPGTITTFDDMRDGQWVTVQPGAQNQVFAHSGTFVMPGGANFTLRTNDGPIRFYKENGTIRLMGTVPLTDGDKGDITVSSNGATWTIDASAISTAKIADDAVTFDKLLNATQAAFIGATGAGAFGERTYAQVRSDLGLVVGTDVQAYDADLAAIAGLTSAADKGIQFTGSGTAATFDLTAAGKALLDDADNTEQRATLGLGSLATKSSVATADLDANAVTFAKFQQATIGQRLVGRDTGASGDYQQLALTTVLDWITATEGQTLVRGASGWEAMTSAALSVSARQVTAANLASSAHAINTAGKSLGAMALETTNNRAYFALGSNATSAWRPFDDQSGTSDITPA